MNREEAAWKTIKEKSAYQCPGFEIINKVIELPNGTQTDFDYLSEPPAVVILPFIDEEKVITIKEWREPVQRVNWGIPVGTMEPDEAPDVAAKRELQEETGYEAGSMEHMITLEPVNGVADTVHHYFIAHNCAPTAQQKLDEDEQIEVDIVNVDKVATAALTGKLRDGRAVTAMYRYLLKDKVN